jgi:hypothetical protein
MRLESFVHLTKVHHSIATATITPWVKNIPQQWVQRRARVSSAADLLALRNADPQMYRVVQRG